MKIQHEESTWKSSEHTMFSSDSSKQAICADALSKWSGYNPAFKIIRYNVLSITINVVRYEWWFVQSILWLSGDPSLRRHGAGFLHCGVSGAWGQLRVGRQLGTDLTHFVLLVLVYLSYQLKCFESLKYLVLLSREMILVGPHCWSLLGWILVPWGKQYAVHTINVSVNDDKPLAVILWWWL